MRLGDSMQGRRWYCKNYYKCGQFKEIGKDELREIEKNESKDK